MPKVEKVNNTVTKVNVIMINVILVSVIMLNAIILTAIILNAILLNAIMLNVIMLNVILVNVIMLNIILLNVIMLNVIMLNVVVPHFHLRASKLSCHTIYFTWLGGYSFCKAKRLFLYQNALAYLVVGEDLEVAGPVVGAEELVKLNALLLSMFENFFLRC